MVFVTWCCHEDGLGKPVTLSLQVFLLLMDKNMDFGLTGKWALVCGASKGLGLGCAKALVAEGVNVVMVARGAEALQVAASKLIVTHAINTGATVQFIAQDITTEAGQAAVFAMRADFDIVVTNAAGPPAGDFRSFERDDWIKAVDANMLTPIALIKATVDGMAAWRHAVLGALSTSRPAPSKRRSMCWACPTPRAAA